MLNYNKNTSRLQVVGGGKSSAPAETRGRKKKSDVPFHEIAEKFHADKDIFLQPVPPKEDEKEKGDVLVFRRENHILKRVSRADVAAYLIDVLGIDYDNAFLNNCYTHIKYKSVGAERKIEAGATLDNQRLLCLNSAIIANVEQKTFEIIDINEYKGAPFFNVSPFYYLNAPTPPPYFAAFLKSLEVSKEEEIAFCEMIGSAILPCTSEHFRHAYLMIGEGENGKSVLMKLIKAITGKDRVYEARLRDLDAETNPFGTACLKYSNVCLIREAKDGKLDTETLKRLASGEEFIIEAKHQQQTNATHSVSVIAACNSLPNYKEEYAVKSRFILLPLHKSFEVGSPDRDEAILQKLLSEKDLIASYCLNLYLKALTGEKPLERCRAAAREILTKDMLGTFIIESLEPDPEGEINRNEIAKQYAIFQIENGYSIESDPYIDKSGGVKPHGGFFEKLSARFAELYHDQKAKVKYSRRSNGEGNRNLRIAVGVKFKRTADAEAVPIPQKQQPEKLEKPEINLF